MSAKIKDSENNTLYAIDNGDFVRVASPWKRLGARFLDWIILGVGGTILAFLGFGVASGIASPGTEDSEAAAGATMLLVFAVIAVLGFAYEVVLTALRGQTVGKRLVGIKVVDKDTGEVPGWGKSLGRWALPNLVGLIPVLGQIVYVLTYGSIVWDFWRRGWHDKAAGTVVVKA